MHTAGVLGGLFAEAIENAQPGTATALRTQGVGDGRIFCYATLPQLLPQRMSGTLYCWKNNIRSATMLGMVGAGGLSRLRTFHIGLFQMRKTGTILGATVLLALREDGLSDGTRRWPTR